MTTGTRTTFSKGVGCIAIDLSFKDRLKVLLGRSITLEVSIKSVNKISTVLPKTFVVVDRLFLQRKTIEGRLV